MADVFGLETAQVGQATLVMGIAMIAGTFIYGPLDRLLHTRKWVVFGGNFAGAIALGVLVALIDTNVVLAVVLIALIGLLGGSFPVIIAHGRSFFPPHLVGRGVTLMNLFGIGGAGLAQFASGRIHEQMAPDGATQAYMAIFGFLGLMLFVGTLVYLFSRDSMD